MDDPPPPHANLPSERPLHSLAHGDRVSNESNGPTPASQLNLPRASDKSKWLAADKALSVKLSTVLSCTFIESHSTSVLARELASVISSTLIEQFGAKEQEKSKT